MTGSPSDVSADTVTISVHRILRGRWEVLLSGRREPITCETLDEAKRVAYLTVVQSHPCELVVHDAYHRVIDRELIDGHHDDHQ